MTTHTPNPVAMEIAADGRRRREAVKTANEKRRDECSHERLAFGSGDYYIFCDACRRQWCLHGLDRPEYGNDKDGKPIGADPSQCVFGFYSIKSRVIVTAKEST